jgi:hypothetical protein
MHFLNTFFGTFYILTILLFYFNFSSFILFSLFPTHILEYFSSMAWAGFETRVPSYVNPSWLLCQARSSTVPELQAKLHELGWQVGARILDLGRSNPSLQTLLTFTCVVINTYGINLLAAFYLFIFYFFIYLSQIRWMYTSYFDVFLCQKDF